MNTNQTTKAEELAKPEPCCWASENVIPLRGLKDNHPAILTATKCAANTIPLYREPPAPAVPDGWTIAEKEFGIILIEHPQIGGVLVDPCDRKNPIAADILHALAEALLAAAPQPLAFIDDRDEQIAELRRQVFSYESMVADRDELLANQWQPIETAQSQQAVLIHYLNSAGNSRIVKARFIPRYTEESSGDSDGVDEYDEANDRYTYIEGWWELVDNWDEYSFIFIDENKPTHWMPMPPKPAIDSKQNDSDDDIFNAGLSTSEMIGGES